MTDPAGSLACRLASTAQAHPERVALRIGSRMWLYAELHEDARRLARLLTTGSSDCQAKVGILAGASSYTAYVGLLATIYAGAVAVPLNTSHPTDRVAATAEAAHLDQLIVDDSAQSVADGILPRLPGVSPIRTSEVQSPDPGVAAMAGSTADPSALAYVMFTSGSTGRPKGVPISLGNLLHFLCSAQERHQIAPNDVLIQTFEPSFDLFLFGPFMAWSAGAELVAAPLRARRKQAEFVTGHGVTVWFSVPSVIHLARRMGALAPGSMPTLRRSLFCGEALREADAADWQAAAPESVVENLYGPTELTIACTVDRWSNRADVGNGVVPIGLPHSGLRHVLLDPHGRVADDEGELCVGGPQMFEGYLDPADDAGRFLIVDGQRYYRTGDRVRRLPDSRLAYLGRLDYQVKIRGYRVELLEIEHALRQVDGVSDCAVTVVDRDGEATLHAAFVGDRAVQDRLTSALAARLPEYLVPRYIWHADALPLNPNGKVDRSALPWLADLRLVVRQLRTIPTALREFGVTEEHAYRVHALTGELLTAAIGLGLPCVESGGSRYFDNLDLSNVSAVLRRPSAWALGQRGWAAGLAALRSGTRSCYELTLAPRCPFPGHRGPCDFSFLLDEVGTEEPSDAAIGELISPGKLRVHTGSSTAMAPERIRGVFACLDGAHYLHLPTELHHDLDYYRKTGLANCMLAADVLLQRARQFGVRARRSFGLIALPPFAGLHTWIDFWVDERWVAFDPHLIRFLERAGVLPRGHWPVHDSLSGLLLRLAPTNTPFIRHNGVHCEASFRLVRTRC